MVGDILLAVYLLVALVFVLRTVVEWRRSKDITVWGMLAGCVLCLVWLPTLLVVGAYQGLTGMLGRRERA